MAVWDPRANEIFLAAVEIAAPDERRAYLDAACAQDPGLHQAVEALLQAHAQAGSFLDGPAVTLAQVEEPTTATVALETAGTLIAGRFKLLQQIGEGGMGTVWMAEQLEPVRRHVALKVIKQGMDSGQVLARFEVERQTLALMDHPNIARVLDAGTAESGTAESGRPFFVMELVKGVVITKYCEEMRLTLRQRLALMIPVCQAVQHAHQKGIIHRDLKPSNVLIALYDGKPVPKVIDFGVAKAMEQRLTDRTLFTGYGSIVGTLEYMSPEQAGLNQVDVDTRSDVYSLGVLLYELLTGSTPLDRKRLKEGALLQVLMMIREVEPPTPSTRLSSSEALATLPEARQTELARLSKLVRGEVDWIVMKALDKDRNRRYATASSFAEDIQRYLADEPVRAGPPSRSYRLRKFVKRNRGAVLGAATVLLALVAGMAGTTWGLVRALDAEREVREWFGEAELKTLEAQAQKKRALLAEADARAQEKNAKAEADDAKKARDEAQRLALAEKTARETAEKNERTAQQQARRAETARHAIAIDQARRAWAVNDVTEAQRVLATVAEPFRKTWETRHLLDLCRRRARPLDKDQDIAFCEVAFAGNVPRIVGVAPDGAVHTWDPAIGRLRRCSERVSVAGMAFKGFAPNLQLALSRDGRFLAEGDGVNDVKVWEAKAHPDKTTFKLLDGLVATNAMAFSPDGRSILLYARDKKAFGVWDVVTGQEKLVLKDARSPVWTEDGRLATIGVEGGLWIRDLVTGATRTVIKDVVGKIEPNQSAHPIHVALSRDGKRVATTTTQGLIVKVWDTATGQELRSFTMGQRFGADINFLGVIAISGNGRWIAADHWLAGSVQVWDVETGTQKATLKGSPVQVPVRSLAISDDGTQVLAGWSPHKPVQLWDLTSGHETLKMKEWPAVIVRLAVNRNGSRIGWGGWGGAIFFCDGDTGKEKFRAQRPSVVAGALAIDPEGKTAWWAENDGSLRGWDMEAGQEKFQIAIENVAKCRIHCAALASDGRRLFTGDADGMIGVWDLVTRRKELTFKAHTGALNILAPSGDGKLLAVSDNKTVRVWDAVTRRESFVLTGHLRVVPCMALSPDGRFLVTSQSAQYLPGKALDQPLTVWHIPSGRQKFTLKGHIGGVASLAITPDGQRIVSAGQDDGTVRLWDAATGQEMLTFQCQSSYLVISGDGRRIVSGGGDGTITVWEAP